MNPFDHFAYRDWVAFHWVMKWATWGAVCHQAGVLFRGNTWA